MPLVVFLDDRYLLTASRLINQRNIQNTFVYLIPINEDFMEKNIRSWRYIEREATIMRSAIYQERIKFRPFQNTPETKFPKYNCLMHSKIDFIEYAMQLKAVQVNSFWFTYVISMSQVIYYWFTYVNSTGIYIRCSYVR